MTLPLTRRHRKNFIKQLNLWLIFISTYGLINSTQQTTTKQPAAKAKGGKNGAQASNQAGWLSSKSSPD